MITSRSFQRLFHSTPIISGSQSNSSRRLTSSLSVPSFRKAKQSSHIGSPQFLLKTPSTQEDKEKKTVTTSSEYKLETQGDKVSIKGAEGEEIATFTKKDKDIWKGLTAEYITTLLNALEANVIEANTLTELLQSSEQDGQNNLLMALITLSEKLTKFKKPIKLTLGNGNLVTLKNTTEDQVRSTTWLQKRVHKATSFTLNQTLDTNQYYLRLVTHRE